MRSMRAALCQHFSFLRQLASGKQSIMQSRRGIYLIFYVFLGVRKAVSRNLISTECGEFKSRTDQKSENMFSIRYLGPCIFYTDICIRILLKNCDNWSIFLYQNHVALTTYLIVERWSSLLWREERFVSRETETFRILMILLCGFHLKFRRKNSCEQATRHFSIFISEKYKGAFSWIWNRDRWSLSGVVIFVRLIDIHTSLSSSLRKIHIFSRMSPGEERLAPSWFFLPVFVAKGGAFNLSPSPWAAPSPVIVSIIIRRHRVDIHVRIVAAVCFKKRTISPFFPLWSGR